MSTTLEAMDQLVPPHDWENSLRESILDAIICVENAKTRMYKLKRLRRTTEAKAKADEVINRLAHIESYLWDRRREIPK